MSKHSDIINSFRTAVEAECFDCQGDDAGTTVEWTLWARFAPIGFRMSFTPSKDSEAVVVQWLGFVRARRHLEGDRTDANEIIATMWAVFWWSAMEQSLLTFQEAHPVVPGEVDIVWLVPSQPPDAGRLICSSVGPLLEIVLAAKQFWNLFFTLTFAPGKQQDVRPPDTVFRQLDWFAGRMCRALRIKHDVMRVTAICRENPYWLYFLSIDKGIGMIWCPPLARTFRSTIKPAPSVSDEPGTFIVASQTNHYIPTGALRQGRYVLSALGEREYPLVVPLENRLVLIAATYILTLAVECGRTEFLQNRERVHLRRQVESSLLFPDPPIRWRQQIDPEQFEELVYRLLAGRPDIEHVRLTSPTRERDGGRDLRIEWRRRIPGPIERPSFVLRLFVGQCKAVGGTVSKKHVMDIRDTIERFGAEGYLLVVSSQLSASLTRDLEQLKTRYDIEWWTRLELEAELRRNPELIKKFGGVFES